MKIKSIAAMLAMLAVSASSVFAVPASAAPEQGSIEAPVSPQYTHAQSVTSALTLSDGTAVCQSTGYGQSHVKSMNCTQYLEKKNLLGKWTITVGTWYKFVQGNYLSMTNTKSGLDSGTYRVKSVFTFYSVGGNEEVTVYSAERP